MAEQMTFKEAQAEAMRIGRENNLSDSQTETTLRRILRKNNIPIPKGMAEKQEFDDEIIEPLKRINRLNLEKKNKGGMAKKKKAAKGKKVPVVAVAIGMGKMKRPQMMKGGMANGKSHMYAGGGSVTDNLTPAQKNMVRKMAAANVKK